MLDRHEQAIRERAYAIWELDERPEGRSLAHWSQAEAEIGTEQVGLENRKRVNSGSARSVTRQPRRQRRAQPA